MKTYKEVLDILINHGDVYVPVFYVTGTMEWFKIDKWIYIWQLHDGNYVNHNKPFPCRVEVENDGEIFFHIKVENN